MEIRKNNHKTLCIILINYNNYHDTVDCVKSIKDSENFELPFVVIVDNSDQKPLLETIIGFYPDSCILSPGKNLGFAEGNNFGIRWAMKELIFDWLFILNNDTILLKDTLSSIVSSAEQNPSYSLFAPCIITADNPGRIWYAGGSLKFSRMTPVILNIEKEFNSLVLYDGETEFASGCSILVSVKRFGLEQEFFDPFFFMYDEDVEFSLRMKKQSEKIFFVSRSVVIHKCQGSQNVDCKGVTNQLSPFHPNLLFYLRNTIKNRFYTINLHFTGNERNKILIQNISYWILKSCQFALYLRFKASAVTISEVSKCINSSILFRKTPKD